MLLECSDCLVNDQQHQTRHMKDEGRNKHSCCQIPCNLPYVCLIQQILEDHHKVAPNEFNCI